MTHVDIHHDMLIFLLGIAPHRPAEFVIFRVFLHSRLFASAGEARRAESQ